MCNEDLEFNKSDVHPYLINLAQVYLQPLYSESLPLYFYYLLRKFIDQFSGYQSNIVYVFICFYNLCLLPMSCVVYGIWVCFTDLHLRHVPVIRLFATTH